MMYDNLISSCEQRGGHISLSEVIQSMVDDIKLILEKEQIDFIASHGMKWFYESDWWIEWILREKT